MSVWKKKSFCLITGASRGLGRELAIQFSNNVKEDSAFLIMATNDNKIQETKSLMSRKVKVLTKLADLGQNQPPSQFESLIREVLAESVNDADSFENVILIQNAGSIGDISKSVTEFETEELMKYYSLNVFSFVSLTNAFFNVFTGKKACEKYVVNISSLAAVQPLNGFGMYCSGKAARESLMKVLALEEPSVRILSYAPGPLQTAMTEQIKETGKDDVKEVFKGLDLLTCEQSVKKLITILDENQFTSGDRIDYYDA